MGGRWRWAVNQAPEIPLATPNSREASVTTVGAVALYLLIMMTHSDADCLTMLTLNQTLELVKEYSIICW